MTEGRALLVVNDRVDIALLSGADGVQLGENGLDAASARRLVGPEMLIGRSVHSVEGAAEAEADGADFLVLGTIFETASHPGADTGGLELVRDVTGRVGIPVIGIGGISESNVGGLDSVRGGGGGGYHGYFDGGGSERGRSAVVGGYAAGALRVTLTHQGLRRVCTELGLVESPPS